MRNARRARAEPGLVAAQLVAIARPRDIDHQGARLGQVRLASGPGRSVLKSTTSMPTRGRMAPPFVLLADHPARLDPNANPVVFRGGSTRIAPSARGRSKPIVAGGWVKARSRR
jgi:hypothetical protein